MCITGHPHWMLPKMFFTLILTNFSHQRFSECWNVMLCGGASPWWWRHHTSLKCQELSTMNTVSHPKRLGSFSLQFLKLNFVSISHLPCAILYPIHFAPLSWPCEYLVKSTALNAVRYSNQNFINFWWYITLNQLGELLQLFAAECLYSYLHFKKDLFCRLCHRQNISTNVQGWFVLTIQ
jgi:hypothetical protein